MKFVIACSVSIDICLAQVIAAISNLIFELVELLSAQVRLIIGRLGTLGNFLNVRFGLLCQVVCLLKLKKDLGLKIHRGRTIITFTVSITLTSSAILLTCTIMTLQDIRLVDLVGDVHLLIWPLNVLILQTHCVLV